MSAAHSLQTSLHVLATEYVHKVQGGTLNIDINRDFVQLQKFHLCLTWIYDLLMLEVLFQVMCDS